MKIIERNCSKPVFQGDVAIMRVKTEELPNDLNVIENNIIAKSETHHDHKAEGATVLGNLDPMIMFMKAKGEHVDIVHHRSFDTHETIRFLSEPGDTFVIKRQREWAPEGWRRVED